jgi:hypothetical protein
MSIAAKAAEADAMPSVWQQQQQQLICIFRHVVGAIPHGQPLRNAMQEKPQ